MSGLSPRTLGSSTRCRAAQPGVKFCRKTSLARIKASSVGRAASSLMSRATLRLPRFIQTKPLDSPRAIVSQPRVTSPTPGARP